MEITPSSVGAGSVSRDSVYRLAIPREHGSWALWLLPLLSGAAVGLASNNDKSIDLHAVIWFLLAATSAFLAHQPLEALLGRSLVKIRTVAERNFALRWTIALLALAVLAIGKVVSAGYPLVLWFVLAAASLFAIKIVLGHARSLRAAGQIMGALGLTSTAPGAYYAVSGKIDANAFLLWGVSWSFAASQIEYVQLRIRTANAGSLREKAQAGWKIYLLHLALPAIAGMAAFYGQIPVIVALAFVPSALRLIYWAMTPPRRLRVHWLGVTELMQSLVFNALLTTGMILVR